MTAVRPNRVLMVAPQPCFEVRGTPINILQMCRSLTELGFEVHLATYAMGPTVDMPGLVYHRSISLPGIRSVPIGFSCTKILLDVALQFTVLRLLLTRRFVAVHAVEEAAFFAVPMGRLFRTPVVSDLDSDIGDQLSESKSAIARALAGVARWTQRIMLRRSAAVVTVCQSLTDLVNRISPGVPVFQIEDIPLPSADRAPDPDRLADLRRKYDLHEKRVILYTGNLEHYQGVDLLVDALPAVVKTVPNAVALIVGGEPEQIDALKKRAAALRVDAAFLPVGKQPAADMPEFMGLAEILASPRREGENTPLKIYTYMLSGRPIVATGLPTHTQVLDDSNAVLTPVSAEGTADGLLFALNNADRVAERGRRAREKVLREHNYETFRRKMGDVYARVTGITEHAACEPT